MAKVKIHSYYSSHSHIEIQSLKIQSLVSYDPPEIILIFWFGVKMFSITIGIQ